MEKVGEAALMCATIACESVKRRARDWLFLSAAPLAPKPTFQVPVWNRSDNSAMPEQS